MRQPPKMGKSLHVVATYCTVGLSISFLSDYALICFLQVSLSGIVRSSLHPNKFTQRYQLPQDVRYFIVFLFSST